MAELLLLLLCCCEYMAATKAFGHSRGQHHSPVLRDDVSQPLVAGRGADLSGLLGTDDRCEVETLAER